jgi:carbon-monoxide dehydrogenase large subunit/6-hydroxypseudooxynicotine dehydrogenase subunit gamma
MSVSRSQRSSYLAEDGAELVSVEADVLTPILDASAVPGSFASGVSTEALVLRAGYGDVEAAFAAAYALVALDLAIGRHSAVPIETRGALSRFDAASDVLELYGAAKVAHRNRDALARPLSLGRNSVRSDRDFPSDFDDRFNRQFEIFS